MEKPHLRTDKREGQERRARPRWAAAGGFWLIVLVLHAACATRAPMAGLAGGGRFDSWGAPEDETARAGPATEPGLEGRVVLDVVVLEPGRVRTRPVPITQAEFRDQVERLARGLQLHGGPQQVAAELLKVQELLHEAQESGWAELVMKSRVATTCDELREAGAGFAKVLGTDAARAMILAVTALSGRTLAEVGTVLRSLPSYRLAQLQLAGQGGPGWVLVRVEQVQAVAASAEGALAVTAFV